MSVQQLAPVLRAMPTPENHTCLYFVQDEDGPIKVGVTSDPQARLRVMQNGNPRRLSAAADRRRRVRGLVLREPRVTAGPFPSPNEERLTFA